MTIQTQTTLRHQVELQAEIDAGALFVINHSGGKDSQAMYAVVTSLVPADQIIVIHADLVTADWAGLQNHISSQIDGHELHVARAQHGRGILGQDAGVTSADFFSMVRNRHAKNLDNQAKKVAAGDVDASLAAPFPAPNLSRQCTSDLKTGPINKVITRICNEQGFTRVVSCTGIRAQESTDRKAMPTWEIDQRHSNGKRTIIDFHPIHDILEEEVWKIIDLSGQTRHFAYDLGMSRLSCCFCIFGSDDDLRIAAENNPELYRRYVELEKEVGFTMKMDRRGLEDHTGIRI
jgi:DNA sulfur modification protein DndC